MDQAALGMSLYAGLHDHQHALIARQCSLFILDNKKFVHLGQAFLWFRAPFSKSLIPTFPSSLKAEEQGHPNIPCSWQEEHQNIPVQDKGIS